jgi:hypothetical protein
MMFGFDDQPHQHAGRGADAVSIRRHLVNRHVFVRPVGLGHVLVLGRVTPAGG